MTYWLSDPNFIRGFQEQFGLKLKPCEAVNGATNPNLLLQKNLSDTEVLKPKKVDIVEETVLPECSELGARKRVGFSHDLDSGVQSSEGGMTSQDSEAGDEDVDFYEDLKQSHKLASTYFYSQAMLAALNRQVWYCSSSSNPEVHRNKKVGRPEPKVASKNLKPTSSCKKTIEPKFDNPKTALAMSHYKVENYFFYLLFCFGSNLGNEWFYNTFFPFWVWLVDGMILRKMVIGWIFYFAIGQATKEVICWPRPKSPPVIKVESRYACEYGMPSTHAMVGLGMPVLLFYFYYSINMLDLVSYPVFVSICFFWTSVCCLSRLYMGMHSVLDILCGLGYASLLISLILPYIDWLDEIFVTWSYSWLLHLGLPIIYTLLFPQPKQKYTTTRADTSLCFIVGHSILMSYWLLHHFHGYEYLTMHQLKSRISTPLTWSMINPSMLSIFYRILIGLGIEIVLYVSTKPVIRKMLCKVFGLTLIQLKQDQRVHVELSDKYLCYGLIAGLGFYLPHLVMLHFQVHRANFNFM